MCLDTSLVERGRWDKVDQMVGLVAFEVVDCSVARMDGNVRHGCVLTWMVVEDRSGELTAAEKDKKSQKIAMIFWIIHVPQKWLL